MSYEEWLDIIEKLKNSNNNSNIMSMLQLEEVNPNFNELLISKLEKLVQDKFEKAVNKIKSELEMIFSDVNYFDMTMVNFRKDIKFIMDIIKLKQIPADKKVTLTYKVVEGVNDTYDILLKEASNSDPTGVFMMMIKNDRIKWSE